MPGAVVAALTLVCCGTEPVAESAVELEPSNYSGTLVFQSDRHGEWDIFRMEADGTGLMRLTDHAAADQNPSWSPDGKWIAFSSERTGAGDIYVMDADGNDLRRVTEHPSYEGAPRFTPDATALVFEGERDGRAEIYRVELDSLDVERLTDSVHRKLGPAYSPDGAQLAFMEKNLIRWHVAVRDERTGAKHTAIRGGGACRPEWSPDGALLAFVSTRQTDKADLWFREMKGGRDGRAWRVPTRPNAHNYDPAFSSDGMTLALASTKVRGSREQWDIFVSDINGRRLAKLTGDEGNERFPDWRP